MRLDGWRGSRAATRLQAILLVLSMLPALALASPALVAGVDTGLSGQAERLISYRHQEHAWQTADGALHMVLNLGAGSPDASLRLFTSMDNGTSWAPGPSLAGSGDASSSDVMASANEAEIVYSTEIGTLVHTRLSYDPGARTWSLSDSATAFASPTHAAINPALAQDGQGRRWLAHVQVRRSDGVVAARLMVQPSEAQPWVDTGLLFGQAGAGTIERSLRPLRTRHGLGMVFTVHGETFWAHRRDDWPMQQAWKLQSLHVAQDGDVDPFGSHFSAVVDDLDNVHVALVDGGRLIYLRRPAAWPQWSKRVLTSPIQAAYVQASLAGSHVVLVSNHKTLLRVFQSSDEGRTWANTHVLLHPAAGQGESFMRPRNETPARSSDPIPVMQQFERDGTQGLLGFQVPLVQPRPSAAAARR